MSTSRKCFYEVLGVPRDATDPDIKKAYRAQALASHPDKNPGREAEASETFKQVQHAYSVLSDPHERSWYDSHRAQILRGHAPGTGSEEATDPANATEVDLFACFDAAAFRGFGDGREGFFAVYGDVFGRLWDEEVEAAEGKRGPSRAGFGGKDADWETVRDFYRLWEGFSSRKSFSFADKWNLTEAPNRDYRRQMERENKKERAKVKKEFNATVRALVAFVKKRDPRVAARKASEENERAMKESKAEEQKKLREQHRKEEAVKTRAARDEAMEEDAEGLDEILASIALDEKLERRKRRKKGRRRDSSSSESEESASAVEEGAEDLEQDHADFASENELSKGGDEQVVAPRRGGRSPPESSEEDEEEEEEEEEDLYCVACRKPFRTVAQKADHEKSKKHKTAVAKLKKQVMAEEQVFNASKRGKVSPVDVVTPSVTTSTNIANNELQELPNGTLRDHEELRDHEGVPDEVLDQGNVTVKGSEHKKKDNNQNRKAKNSVYTDPFSIAEKALPEPTRGAVEAPAESQECEGFDALDKAVGSAEDTVPAEEVVKKPELTKKQKRRLKEQKKKEQGPNPSAAADGARKCNTCNSSFASRNKLMRHLESSGHALHVSGMTSGRKRV